MTSKRRVGITEFKGVYMVNIREYYEKDGETLPGKKVRGGCGLWMEVSVFVSSLFELI